MDLWLLEVFFVAAAISPPSLIPAFWLSPPSLIPALWISPFGLLAIPYHGVHYHGVLEHGVPYRNMVCTMRSAHGFSLHIGWCAVSFSYIMEDFAALHLVRLMPPLYPELRPLL